MTPFIREVVKAVAAALAMAILTVITKLGTESNDSTNPRS